MKYVLIALAVLLVLGGISVLGIGGITYVKYSNQEQTLRVNATNQETVNMTVKDKTWKTISQMAQVSQDYRETFEKVYPDIMNARYGGHEAGKPSPLLNFIKEANPTFDTKLYEKLMDAITVNQAEFQMVQTKLISIKEQHDLLRTTIPSKWFLSNFFRDCPELKVTIVTSKNTKDMFKTGEDNDVKLFNK